MSSRTAVALFALCMAGVVCSATPPPRSGAPDPLAAEIARWSDVVERDTTRDELWAQIRPGSRPLLESARAALARGRRWVALNRLGAARTNLAAGLALRSLGRAVSDSAAFEAAWRGAESSLGGARQGLDPDGFAGVTPAVVRALAEGARAQVAGYRDASLEYGRSTAPRFGHFYLEAARAQLAFTELCRRLARPERRAAPPLRSLRGEIDRLERELLAAYAPPASIDRHPDFIGAHSTLKEARELDDAGVRHGALLRYLQAALRSAPLRGVAAPAPRDSVAAAIAALDARLARANTDHSIATLFLETAASILEDTAAAARPGDAAAIVRDVLPRYEAALAPPPPPAATPPAEITVTLLRWPYT